MLTAIKQYIHDHALLKEHDHVLVAVSGGADSVALLDLLQRGGYPCAAAHCNFHLRGEESNRDEQFVRSLCEKLKVKLHVIHFDTAAYAKEKHISIEMAARELRYQWFEQLLQEYHYAAIAVAHHRDDQAETLLLNLLRGTGIRGLCGMLPLNGHVIRPLLGVSHQEILDYLTIRQLDHVEDSTNTDTGILRNRIRQQLQQLPPAAVRHIAQTCQLMQGYQQIAQHYIQDEVCQTKRIMEHNEQGETTIDCRLLLQTVAPQTTLFEMLQPYGFTQTDQIYRSLTRQTGRQFYSRDYILTKDRDRLIITPRRDCESAPPKIRAAIRNKRQKETYPPANDWHIIADERIMQKPLTLRHWEKGDRFCPIGMQGKSRLLSDFLTDLHLSREAKKQVWLLCSGEDIAWVVGYRLDERFKVTDRTQRVAEIKIVDN